MPGPERADRIDGGINSLLNGIILFIRLNPVILSKPLSNAPFLVNCAARGLLLSLVPWEQLW